MSALSANQTRGWTIKGWQIQSSAIPDFVQVDMEA